MLFRWYYRLGLWYRFLWMVSRLKLRLEGIHPDRAGGIAFLGSSPYGFLPMLVAHMVLLGGLIGNHLMHEGRHLTDFKVEILGVLLFLLALVLAPLCFFSWQLWRVKRRDKRRFGAFAMTYVRDFDRTWLGAKGAGDPSPLGSGDIQSLADLANSFDVVERMRLVPIGRKSVFELAVALAIPIVPLVLTMIPLDRAIDKFLGILF